MADMAARHTSAAAPLSWAYAALVFYASLFPFSGWRWPPGHDLVDFLVLPWPPWRDDFDLWANLLGYAPWGWLLALAWRVQMRWLAAWLAALAVAACASYAIEVTQTLLPGRHPSLKDWAMNVAGAGLGAGLALAVQHAGAGAGWARWRERWFVPKSGGALALLALWPFALLFPTPVPLGLGQLGPRLREVAEWLVEDVPWAEGLHQLLQAQPLAPHPLPPLSEGLATALGLLAPCMLVYAVSRRGAHRLLLSLGAGLAALLTMTLSSWLNYGPRHALAWLTATTLPAMLGALLAAFALASLPRRVACGIGLMVLATGTALVAQASPDPYFALNLQAWEHGRWVRFHGVTQWVGLIWPFVAMLWLLHRLGLRDDGAPS